MIAVSGLDMAAWDALAKAAGLPLAVMPRRLDSAASRPTTAMACGSPMWRGLGDEAARAGGRRRLQGPQAPVGPRPAGRRSRGDRGGARCGRRRRQADGRFQPGAQPRRCAAPLPRARRSRPLLVRGADRLRQSRGLRAADARARQRRCSSARISMDRARLHEAVAIGAGDLCDARPHAHRRRDAAGCAPRRSPAPPACEMSTHLYPEFSAHLMRVTETAHWLEWQDWADPILADAVRTCRRLSHGPRPARRRRGMERRRRDALPVRFG